MNAKPTWSLKTSIASEAAKSCELITQILDQLKGLDWDEGDVFKIHLALEEAMMNAIKHGNKNDPAKSVNVACEIFDQLFSVRINDEGSGFKRETIPDPTKGENIYATTGRGLTIMENFMTSVNYEGGGNTIQMTKEKSSPAAE